MLAAGIAGSLMSLGAIDFGLIVDSAVIVVENCVSRLAHARPGSRRRRRRPAGDAGGPPAGRLRRRDHHAGPSADPGAGGDRGQDVPADGPDGDLRPDRLAAALADGDPGARLVPAEARDVGARHLAGVLAKRAYRPVLGFARAEAGARRRRRVADVRGLPAAGDGPRRRVHPGAGRGRPGPEHDPAGQRLAHRRPWPTRPGWSGRCSTPSPTRSARSSARPAAPRSGSTRPASTTPSAIIYLTDPDDWTRATDKDDLIRQVEELVHRQVPGTTVVFSQPIELRFSDMLAGAKGDVGLGLYGDDLEVLDRDARAAEGDGRGDPGRQRGEGPDPRRPADAPGRHRPRPDRPARDQRGRRPRRRRGPRRQGRRPGRRGPATVRPPGPRRPLLPPGRGGDPAS